MAYHPAWVIDGKASLSVLAGERLLMWQALRLLALAESAYRRETVQGVERALLDYLQSRTASTRR